MVTVEPLRNYMQQRIQGGQFGSVSFLSLLLNTVPVWCGQRDIFSVLDTVFCIGRFHDLTSNCVGASGSFWRLWGAAAGMAAPVSFTVYQEATGSASQEAGCSNTSFLAGALILESVLPSTGCYRFQACCKVPALSQLSEESHTTPVSVYWLGKKAKLTWILRNFVKAKPDVYVSEIWVCWRECTWGRLTQDSGVVTDSQPASQKDPFYFCFTHQF